MKKVLNHLEHITHIEGKATYISPNKIEVDGQKYQAKKFIIAAGSTAKLYRPLRIYKKLDA